MNARQKAKKYKQELDYLKNHVYKPRIVERRTHNTRKIAATRRVSVDNPLIPQDIVMETVILDLCHSDALREAIKVIGTYDFKTRENVYNAYLVVVEDD